MVIYERYYDSSHKLGKKNDFIKSLSIELIAVPSVNGAVVDKRGYYFRGDYEIKFDKGGVNSIVLPQVHGKFSKHNYSDSTGWYWYWHEGSLKSLSIFIQELDGFKPIESKHRELLKNYIEKLEGLESRCTK